MSGHTEVSMTFPGPIRILDVSCLWFAFAFSLTNHLPLVAWRMDNGQPPQLRYSATTDVMPMTQADTILDMPFLETPLRRSDGFSFFHFFQIIGAASEADNHGLDY